MVRDPPIFNSTVAPSCHPSSRSRWKPYQDVSGYLVLIEMSTQSWLIWTLPYTMNSSKQQILMTHNIYTVSSSYSRKVIGLVSGSYFLFGIVHGTISITIPALSVFFDTILLQVKRAFQFMKWITFASEILLMFQIAISYNIIPDLVNMIGTKSCNFANFQTILVFPKNVWSNLW